MGIAFTHVNGARGDKWMPETMGGGVAVLDYDGDGRPDLLFVSGAYWPGDPRAAEQKSSLALYRNEGIGADGLPHFRDVDARGGARAASSTAWAPPVGDYDNDGRDDVYVTALGRNYLFHNLGGRFEEVAAKAGVADSGWGTSAAWLDYDGDGLLDLFVCRYVDWTPKKDLFCTLDGKTKSYCTPERYPGTPSHLYRNLGGGRFEDVDEEGGHLEREPEGARRRPLGLQRRRQDGPPRRQRHRAEQPLPQQGRRRRSRTSASRRASRWTRRAARAARWASAWGDTKNGQGATLAIGNFSNELKSLYWTDTGDVFLDESPEERRRADVASLADVRRLLLRRGPRRAAGPLPRQRPRRADRAAGAEGRRRTGRRRSSTGTRATDSFAAAARAPAISRAPMVGARRRLRGPRRRRRPRRHRSSRTAGPRACSSTAPTARTQSVRVQLVGTRPVQPRRDRRARRRRRSAGATLTQQVSGGQSYLSAPEKTLTFGLGGAPKIDTLEIRWPDGATQTLNDVPGGARLTVAEGKQ